MSKREQEISRYFDRYNLKHSLLGYRYLIAAVQTCIDYPLSPINIFDIYKKIAEDFDVSCGSVERAIRYELSENHITNKEFILKTIDALNCNIGNE